MPSASPSAVLSHISPRLSPSRNLNPFAPLSPDNGEQLLPPEGAPTYQASKILDENRALVVYRRVTLLEIAKRCREKGWKTPNGFLPLEHWYGPFSAGRSTHSTGAEDPAIISMGPAAGPSSRRPNPGYGEGFGFGGGIGGSRNMARGAKNAALRREPQSANATDPAVDPERSFDLRGNLGKSSARPFAETRGPKDLTNETTMASRRDEGEWRRNRGDTARKDGPRAAGPRRDDDAAEPAWLFDGPVTNEQDLPISSDPDHLVQFVPGEDAIAAHKRAMKAKNAPTGKDRGGHMFPFFADSAASAPSLAKPKAFVAANYLRVEEEAPDNDPGHGETSFNGSRFQKFFGPGGVPDVEVNRSPPPMSQPPPVEDHLSRLMGVLRTTSNPQVSDSAPQRGPPHVISPPPPRPQAMEVLHPALLMRPSNSERPPSAHNNSMPPPELLQQLYNPVRQPTGHFTDHRQFQQYQARGFDPNAALHDYPAAAGYDPRPNVTRQDHHPIGLQQGQQQYYGRPPGHEYGLYAPNPPISSSQPPARPMRGTHGLGSAQQEMLATLFAGSRPNP